MKSLSPFCISAYLIHQQKYLLIRRCSSYLNGTWQMISGGVEENETAIIAALREMKEETGIIPDRFYSADTVETFYFAKQDKILVVPVFVGFIDSMKEVVLSPTEHDAYEWLSFEEAHERLNFAEQKRVLSHIHHQFVLK
ncbi:MAG TPA: NUDIX domain-containing protein, partial [Chlamydiales bacterium]|nr:NUDIX domain-containing protein [Chlamydiales bacterium]